MMATMVEPGATELAVVIAEDIILEPTITLHQAVKEGKLDDVDAWIKWLERHPKSKYNTLYDADGSGNTAAHHAALLNDTESLEKLIKFGSDFVQNQKGMTPLHLACIKGHVEAVNLILLQCCSTSDATRYDVLVARDKEYNTPLHLAMEHGHKKLAVDLLNFHWELANLSNDLQQTPLHLAAKSNWIDVIDLLLESGANIEAPGAQLQTPLLVATEYGNVDAVIKLMKEKASIEKVDYKDRNIIHLAAKTGNHVLFELFQNMGVFVTHHNLCCALDSEGRTPLHFAAQHGNETTVKLLLEAKVPTDAKNDQGRTPIHIAAECGYSIVVQTLLLYRKSAVNDVDKSGCTPLYLACMKGHKDVAQVLITSGASVDHSRKTDLETPLHAAARTGSHEVVKLVINAGAFVNPKNRSQQTPLSLVLTKREPKVQLAITLLQSGAKPEQLIGSEAVANELIKNLPDVAEDILDSCIEGRKAHDSLHLTQKEDCLLNLNFGLLEPVYEDSFEKEVHPLSLMVKHRRFKLLKHPVVKHLIKYKWAKYGRFFYLFNLSFYAVFLVLLTSFALVALNPLHPTCVNVFSGFYNSTGPEGCEGLTENGYRFVLGSAIIITLLTCVRIALELFQFLRLQLLYFKDTINWLEITLYFSTLNFIWIFHTPCLCVHEEQWETGAIAIFLGWIILALNTDKLPLAGLYVVMFTSIFKTFLKTVVLSLLLIISFGLAFYMLFHRPGVMRVPFSSPILSLIKTMTMTEGEFDFDNNFALVPGANVSKITYPITSFALWIIFLILMSILLTNLLTGLAVDDVKAIQDNAKLKRLELKVEFVLGIDGFRHQYQQFLPAKICEWLDTETDITVWVYHNLSVWQKILSWLLRDEHDLMATAEDFAAVVKRSQVKQAKNKVSPNSSHCSETPELQQHMKKMLETQEQMKQEIKETFDTLKRTISDLSTENQELKQTLLDVSRHSLEMKQAILKLCSQSQLQENILSPIAKEQGTSLETDNGSVNTC